MGSSRFLGDIDITQIAEKVYSKNRNATLWDILVELFASQINAEPFIIWMLSDLPVIELVARGHSIDYIASYLEIHKKEVEQTCKVWGMSCMSETLDFDPVQVYKEGMTIKQFKEKISPLLLKMPSIETLEDVIINVEKYRSVKKLLDKWSE